MRFTTRPELLGTRGMVSSTHWLASATGMRILEQGGNAFDAGVAAGFALQVVEPHLNGPAGEVPILLYSSRSSTVHVVNGQGRSPAKATLRHYRDELRLDLVPGTGVLAACVPGAFDAWLRVLAEFGSVRLRDVLEPAIGYAAGGIPVVPRMQQTIADVESLFRHEWPTSAQQYLDRDAGVPAVGSRFTNAQLASTYTRLLTEAEAHSADRDKQIQHARESFYRGFVAEAIHDFVASTEVMDSTGEAHKGVLTYEDLAAHEADVEPPTTFDYADYRVCKTGPWGQGPVFLQQLALLQGFDLADTDRTSPEFIHTVIESAKLAFADREAWYGDPSFVDVPLERLLSAKYNDERRALIGETASLDLIPGRPDGRVPVMAEAGAYSPSSAAGAGEPTVRRNGVTKGDTCQVDVVDANGNLFAATPSGGWLQSSPAIPDLGFPLGTRAQMFWLVDGHANVLAPRKRPRTTLTPSIVLRDDGRPYLAFGTPGGDTQDQWSLVFFLSHIHHGLGLQESIDAPMFHSEHFPSSFYPREASPGRVVIENRVDAACLAELTDRGHRVQESGPWSLGRLAAVGSDDTTGFLKAAANPRGMQGYAVGR